MNPFENLPPQSGEELARRAESAFSGVAVIITRPEPEKP